jgi:hypothetical protein
MNEAYARQNPEEYRRKENEWKPATRRRSGEAMPRTAHDCLPGEPCDNGVLRPGRLKKGWSTQDEVDAEILAKAEQRAREVGVEQYARSKEASMDSPDVLPESATRRRIDRIFEIAEEPDNLKAELRANQAEISDQATGIAENPSGLGQYYLDGGREVNTEEAQDALLAGEQVEVPNAGAGSFRSFFKSVGCDKVEVWDWTSSAGDWVFGVRDGPEGMWYPAFQSNRYPGHGMSYSIDRGHGFPSWEDLMEYMGQQ